MNIKDKIVILVTMTLCIGMVGALIIGLFDPSINNDKIFEIIAPSFQTVIGGFIGLITGIKIGSDDNK